MMKNNEFLDYIDKNIVDKQPIIASVRSFDKDENTCSYHNELLVISDFTGHYNWYDYNINDESDNIVSYGPLSDVITWKFI
jgi:hypothetical protein